MSAPDHARAAPRCPGETWQLRLTDDTRAVLQVHAQLKSMRRAVNLEIPFIPLCYPRTYRGRAYTPNLCVGISGDDVPSPPHRR